MCRVPLLLWNRPRWELRGRADPAAFFRSLGAALPQATTLFLEGSSIAPDVQEYYGSVAEPGDYLPERQTLWPRPVQARLPFGGPVLAALAGLAERHAPPELLDHLFVYAGPEPLVEFPDAFGRNSPLLASSEVGEADLRALAQATGFDRVDRVATDR